MYYTSITGANDLAPIRTITLDNGNKVNFSRDQQYGHWKISMERGQLPVALRGVYTGYEDAKRAALRYLTDVKKRAPLEEILTRK